MSLFGEVETSRAERPGPVVKPLTELSLRVYGARFEPEENVVRLHAEAKTEFADGTTGVGVSVGFFLNGRRLSDIVSDEYGLAMFDEAVPADRFHDGENELIVRVKGFVCEVIQAFVVEQTQTAKELSKRDPPNLEELSLVLHKSVIDPTTNDVILRAEAKAILKDKTILPGIRAGCRSFAKPGPCRA